MIANINSCFKCYVFDFAVDLVYWNWYTEEKAMKEVALCTPKVISPEVEERKKFAAKIARECFDLDESVYINASHV